LRLSNPIVKIPGLNIPEFLERCSRLKVLVIGDLMLDHYIEGDALRISPEAPVPVVHIEQDRYVPGGAANVATNLSGLGTKPILAGSYGTDAAGQQLAALLSAQGIELMPVGQRAEVRTIVKSRVIVRRQQLARLDREGPRAEYAFVEAVRQEGFREALQSADAVILSDYAKGVLSDEVIHVIREMRGKAGSFVLAMDPKPKRCLDISGMDLMTPNWQEALQLAKLDEEGQEAPMPEDVAKRICDTYNPAKLVITLGSEGMLLCENGNICGQLPTVAREVFDVSGAGDTVIATLTAAIAAGYPLVEAAAYANFAAGIVVGHFGTAPISHTDLLNSL
jgi:D-beta-D-heptose 7-phosphate kinase/D-beta-D-heptose 1-phosphate adenosyltransferase